MAIPVSTEDFAHGALFLYSHLDDYPFSEQTKLWAATTLAPLEAQSRRVLPLEQSQGSLTALKAAAAGLTTLIEGLDFSADIADVDQALFVGFCSTIDDTRLNFNGHETLKDEASATLKDLMSALRVKVCGDMLARQEMQHAGAAAAVGGTDWNGTKSDFTFLDVVKARLNDWEPEEFGEFEGDDAVVLMERLANKHLVDNMK